MAVAVPTPTVQTSTSFLSPDNGKTPTGPFLLPQAFNTSPPAVLTLNVPYVAGTATPGGSGCTIAPATGNPDFALTKWIAGTGVPVTTAVITVQPANVFSTAPAARTQLWNSFFVFRQALDALEASGCLVAGGAAVLGARVAQALPLTYDETLKFYYGLRPELRCVDLVPGMTLRVDYGGFGYVGPPAASGGRNAYGGAGSSRFGVRRRPDGTLGLDALVDRFAAYQNPTPDQFNQVGGLLDLEAGGAMLKYGRIVYPPQIDAVSFVGSAPNPFNNVALIFAGTLANLEQATQDFVNGTPTQATVQQYLFSGRAALSVEIAVSLNRVPVSLPLGTTLRDVTFSRISTLSVIELSTQVAQSTLFLQMWRWAQPSLKFPPPPASAGSVGFEQTTRIVPASGLSQWDVPLFIGDTVTWAVPG